MWSHSGIWLTSSFVALLLSMVTVSVCDATVFEIQDFAFSYGGSTVFEDDFADGMIPAVPPYGEVQGAAGMSETGGKLFLHPSSQLPFLLGATEGTLFNAGATGYIQAVYTDIMPRNNEFFDLELGNRSTGGVSLDVWDLGSGPTVAFIQPDLSLPEPAYTVLVAQPISGFTESGSLTLRLDISDTNTTDGLFEVQPSYWFNSDPATSLPAIQMPIQSLNGQGYGAAFAAGALVPEPGALLLVSSGLAGLAALRRRQRRN